MMLSHVKEQAWTNDRGIERGEMDRKTTRDDLTVYVRDVGELMARMPLKRWTREEVKPMMRGREMLFDWSLFILR